MMRTKFPRLLNRFILRRRLLLFLICLLLLLILFPFIHEHYINYVLIMEVFVTLLLIVGIYIVAASKRTLTIAVLITILVFTIIWFNLILQSKQLLTLGLILEVVFFSITTVTIITHVLEYKKVTADKIYGAICGYLLIGIIWAFIYTTVELAQPGSFYFANGLNDIEPQYFSHRFYFSYFLYYSFVSLTTLGYGDITPLNSIARIFSSLEAVTGQLYIVVLIARLVSLHIAHNYSSNSKNKD